jgi:hypothetical protein
MLESILAVANIQAGELCSKVEGRRNYVICITNDKAVMMGVGRAKAEGRLTAFLWEIAKYNKSWLYFTYKKDALETLKALKEKGYYIYTK